MLVKIALLVEIKMHIRKFWCWCQVDMDTDLMPYISLDTPKLLLKDRFII